MIFNLLLLLTAVWLTILVCTLMDFTHPLVWALALWFLFAWVRVAVRGLRAGGQINPTLWNNRGVRLAALIATPAMALVILTLVALQIYYRLRLV